MLAQFMSLTKLAVVTIGLGLSTYSHADFSLNGALTLKFPTGTKQEIDMPIAYKGSEYDHKFRVGKMEYTVSGRPERYSFALVLQKNNYMWVQEFAKGYFESFDWTIGDKKIRLYKEILAKPVKGDYILSIGETDYFFQQNLAQLTFIFDEEGIKEIEVDGMVASLGLNKAKTPCPEEETEEPLPEGCEAKKN